MINFYIDKAIFICWLMNFITHDLSAGIMHISARKPGIIIFSFILSLVGVFSVFSVKFKLISVLIYPPVILLMFGKCSFYELVRRLAVCISVVMLFGAIFLTVTPESSLTAVNINKQYFFTVKDTFFYSLLGCVYFGVKTMLFFLSCKKKIYTVRIKLNDNLYTTEAMIDTGNSLRVPESGEPVIVAERSLFGDTGQKCGTIPCKTVCGSENTVDIFHIDDLFLTDENIHFRNIYAALVDTPLSKEGNYRVLLHNSLLKE